jgi:hypothetical protein
MFDTVARLHAEDIGATVDELSSEKWRAKVQASIEACRTRAPIDRQMSLGSVFGDAALRDPDVPAAYLAGAYARYGTPTGFRLINQQKGLYLALLIRWGFSELAIDVAVRPGIPGNVTLTLFGETEALAGFRKEMEMIRVTLGRKK